MLEVGSLIDGKYEILRKIGQGGMSVVYLAMNVRANKQWAIKELRKDGVQDYEVVRQGLVAETDILKKLNHPHLPTIVDVIDMEDTFLIVMDYIEGKALSDHLREEGALPQTEVVEWSKQICDVLGYLHSRKPPIIYRDLKPSNIMLEPDRKNIKIIDFGTAREFKASSVEDTKCLGTMGYAAPEQYGGHGQTDARTDIYCLGATMYHLLTGHNPSQPPYEMYPIRYWNPNLSSGLEEIILKCTQKDPAARYQNCAELMYALDHYTEMDEDYRRKQNLKWTGFMASCILSAACAVGAFAFHQAENNTTTSAYARYISSAETSATQDDKIAKCRQAIILDPSNEEGYNYLLQEVFLEDGMFTQTEAAAMTEILGYTGSGTRDNQSYFKANQDAYDSFAFDMGIAYFYFYGENGNRQMSQKWFSEASGSSTLDMTKVQGAVCFEKIADFYAQMNMSDKSGYSSITYIDYWNDMVSIIDGDVSALGNEKTVLVIYKDFVYQIAENAVNFKNSRVSQSDMEEKLNQVESALRLCSDVDGLKTQIEQNINVARRSVQLAFQSVTNTQNEGGGQDG